MNTIVIVLLWLPTVCLGNPCTYSFGELICSGIYQSDFFYEFYRSDPTVDCYITIVDSNYATIRKFPNPTILSRSISIRSLRIKHSSVEDVHEDAFEELTGLHLLDLSWNNIKDISFVRTLPDSLYHLDLSNNNIVSLDANLLNVRFLNFSHNLITKIQPPRVRVNLQAFAYIDLSYNQLVEFNETELNFFLESMDLSYNNLSSITVKSSYGQKKQSIKLSGNNITQIKSVYQNRIYVENLDLKSSVYKTANIFSNYEFYVIKLIVSHNYIPVLNNHTLNINSTHYIYPYWQKPTIDLTSSSVSDIAKFYFANFGSQLLNLSGNSIEILRDYTFNEARINNLDISYSNLKHIERNAFNGLKSDRMNLSGNSLKNITYVFDNTQITEINLSFNPLVTVSNNSFLGCRGLKVLIISNALITKIESGAFNGLTDLDVLNLINNKLSILQGNTFHQLPLSKLRLQGNNIKAIKAGAFDTLDNLKELNLSGLGITTVESHAFINLRTDSIDLRYNNISLLPENLFYLMQHTKRVYLNRNNITVVFHFYKTLKLDELSVTFNGVFHSNFMPNTHLKKLFIDRSGITVLEKNCFLGLYNLHELHFNNTNIYSIEEGALNGLFNLKYLDAVSLFKFEKVIRSSSFKDLRNLLALNLSNLMLTDIELEAFVGLDKLESLYLNGNNLSYLKNEIFNGLKSLILLDLSNNKISNFDLSAFNRIPNLKSLYLNNNYLVYIKPGSFKNFKNLTNLYLHSNNIEALEFEIFYGLSELRQLRLDYNKISCFKTGVFTGLEHLAVLNISNNAFSDSRCIPRLFSLKYLTHLDLENTNLDALDYNQVLYYFTRLRHIGINKNRFSCELLRQMLRSFENRQINYLTNSPVLDRDNIDGIMCVDENLEFPKQFL